MIETTVPPKFVICTDAPRELVSVYSDSALPSTVCPNGLRVTVSAARDPLAAESDSMATLPISPPKTQARPTAERFIIVLCDLIVEKCSPLNSAL